MVDLSEENIKKLHQRCKQQDKDLYMFLKDEFPDLSTEDRLKYLATVLNDFLEEYEWDEKAPRHKDEGYSIVKFFPKKD
jgi:DNA-binding transcriptional regulator GbsR (MarR family)